MNKRLTVYLPWVLIGIGTVLRCIDLTTSPLWYDEAYTRLVIGLPLSRMIEATAGDVHPPLYYLILHGLAGVLGNSPLVLRMFSVLCSVAALVVFWYLSAAMRLDHTARVVSMGLVALWPVEIYYAKEARMYAWLQLLVLVQLLSLYQRRWVWLFVSTLLALYTHNYALIYSAVIGGVGLVRYRRNVTNLIMSMGGAAILWIPWAGVVFVQMRRLESSGYWIQPLTLGSVMFDIYQIIAGFNVPETLIPLTVFCLAAGLTMMMIEAVRHRHGTLLALALGPLALLVVGSLVWHPILLFRGLLPSLPALAAIAGIALAGADLRGRLIAAALLVPMILAAGNLIIENRAGHIKGVPLWYPVQNAEAPVIHLDDTTMIYSQVTANDYLLDAGCPEEHGALTNRTRTAMGYQVIKLEDLPETYYFAAMLSPLATRCHEDLFNQLTATARTIYIQRDNIDTWGVWHHAIR